MTVANKRSGRPDGFDIETSVLVKYSLKKKKYIQKDSETPLTEIRNSQKTCTVIGF